jgi:DNA-directed RNA polymerase subunit RPC12/RpoP
MSIVNPESIECPKCRKSTETRIWHSLNVELNPEAKKELLEGRLNAYKCAHCGHEAIIGAPLLYHDMGKKFAVQYYPPPALDDPSFYDQFTADGRPRIDLPEGAGDGKYLKNPHLVFSMQDLVIYVVFRDRLADVKSGKFKKPSSEETE